MMTSLHFLTAINLKHLQLMKQCFKSYLDSTFASLIQWYNTIVFVNTLLTCVSNMLMVLSQCWTWTICIAGRMLWPFSYYGPLVEPLICKTFCLLQPRKVENCFTAFSSPKTNYMENIIINWRSLSHCERKYFCFLLPVQIHWSLERCFNRKFLGLR